MAKIELRSGKTIDVKESKEYITECLNRSIGGNKFIALTSTVNDSDYGKVISIREDNIEQIYQ
jgi:hypothetical protein